MILKREDINVSQLLYNPFEKRSITKLKNEHKEFKIELKGIDIEKIIIYIILYYDFGSDLKVAYKEYQRRKRMCMALAGYELEPLSKFYPQMIEEIMLGQNKMVNKMIVRYISLFGKPELQQYHSYHQLFNDLNTQIIDGTYEGTAKAIIEACDKLRDRINDLELILFGGKESLDLRADLYKDVDNKRKVRPEDIVREIKKGGKVFENFEEPYGSAYSVDPIKFINDK